MSSEIHKLILEAGDGPPAPQVSVMTIAAEVKRRKNRRRSLFAIATFGLAAVAIGGAGTWVSPPSGDAKVAPEARAPLSAAAARPACPPDPGTVTLAQPSSSPGPFGPTLTLGASPVAIDLVLHVHPPSNMPDRYITEARLIMVTAEVAKSDSMSLSRALSPSNWPKGHVYDDPANQVAKAVVSRPGENQAVTLALPSDLPSGTYAIYYEALYPGPSLCGEENANPPTSMGSIHQTVATVTVP